jgi:DNA polymerase epsilon subunit 1
VNPSFLIRSATFVLQRQWICEDCGTPYDVDDIEERLISVVNKKMLRYQLQDIRDQKTNRVVTRCLPKLSECSTGLKLDIPQSKAKAELELLKSLAEFHDLESLKQTTEGLLTGFL